MAKLNDLISSRLRDARREKGLTLEQVAEAAGTTFAQIHKLERSQRPLTAEWIERLAAALQIDPVDLMTARPPVGVRAVPIVGRIAAGNWRLAVQEADGQVHVANAAANAFALRPDGDSMDLILPEGGYVVIDPDDLDLRDGSIYAVMNGEGETTLKRYRADPSRLEPCSTNETHRTISLGREPFSVIGRATEAVRRL